MNLCDLCERPIEDKGASRYIVVELTNQGQGARDERKLEAHVCPGCFALAERTITDALRVRSTFAHEPGDFLPMEREGR